MSIKEDLVNWDGKSADDISAIYNRHLHEPSLISDIIKLIEHVPFQKGATWLLKRYFEDGRKLKQKDVDRIYRLLPRLKHWETKLHILQCFPYMPIAKTKKIEVESFLRDCLVDTNKFIRAWAYNGFYELSVQYQEYKVETKQFFDMALRDEAPSVKARVRNIIRRGF
jgi:hypothetical protein